jgi:hypothetical protein
MIVSHWSKGSLAHSQKRMVQLKFHCNAQKCKASYMPEKLRTSSKSNSSVFSSYEWVCCKSHNPFGDAPEIPGEVERKSILPFKKMPGNTMTKWQAVTDFQIKKSLRKIVLSMKLHGKRHVGLLSGLIPWWHGF